MIKLERTIVNNGYLEVAYADPSICLQVGRDHDGRYWRMKPHEWDWSEFTPDLLGLIESGASRAEVELVGRILPGSEERS